MPTQPRASTGALLSLLVLAGCTNAADPESRPTPTPTNAASLTDAGRIAIQVEPGEPAVLEFADGATVVLPAGAVDVPSELTAQLVPPSDTPPDEWQVIGPIVDITLERALGKPAELRLQDEVVEGGPEATQVFAATFDEDDQEWVVLPTQATADGWTAVTHHFSDFGWFTDLSDWAVGAWADLQGRRAPEPDCVGEPPDWSDSVYLSERNSPLRVCVGHDPADNNQLVVKIANNRGYGMLVEVPQGAAWVWQRGLPSAAQNAMSDYLGTIFGGIEASATGLRYLPPGDEIHVGLSHDAVASTKNHAIIDLPTQVSVALITAIQSLISQAVGIVGDDGWVGAFVAIQAMAACTRAGIDVAHQTNVLTAAQSLQTCVVNNFDAIVDAIAGSEAAWQSFGPVQGIDQLGGKTWGHRAAAVLRGIHIARVVDTLGFLGELASDASLSAAAKQVNVYATPQRSSDDWLVAPGRLGPLTIGASGAGLARAGIVVSTPDDMCGSPYELSRDTFDESIGEQAVYTEWRFGASQDDLDGILIKGQQFRTERGFGVGSSRHDIDRSYGDELKTATMDMLIDDVAQVDVVYGPHGALVFHIDERGIVTTMQLLPGGPGERLENMALGC